MDFGIMFFSSVAHAATAHKYRLLIEATKFADAHGFCCVWTPERHFHEFGGLFPNPSITSAALAMITERLQLRAGSLISPLHDPIRIAEDWSVVDNLSGGRVAVAFGSGWNVNDFLFFPARYESRRAVMYQQIEAVKRLWKGDPITQKNSMGTDVCVRIYPQPVQEDLPIWITSSGNADTFVRAGTIGANILTHLIGQDIESLAKKIQKYREARAVHHFDPQQGKVSLMLHTFMGPDIETVKAKVRHPFRHYLKSAIGLEQLAAMGGGVISGAHKIAAHDIPPDALEELLDVTFDRYFHTSALMGTPTSCEQLVWQLQDIGVDEVASLIDFLDDQDAIMESLVYLDQFQAAFLADATERSMMAHVDRFLDDLES